MRRTLVAVVFAALGCGQAASPGGAPGHDGALEPGVVARVGGRAISAASVGRIAAAQQIAPAAARDLAVRDALLAEGATERRLDRSLDVLLTERAMLARRLLHVLRAEAARAEITSEELTGFRTAHAVVRFDANAPEDKRKKALELALAIRAAALPVADKAAALPQPAKEDPLAAVFRQAVLPFTGSTMDVVVEVLPEVAADGRVLAPIGETFDPAFTRAAAALSRRGEVSPVTVSSFGAHVIVLLERTPPENRSEAELRLLREDIVSRRARAAEEKLLAGLRGGSALGRDADALLALCAVDP